MPALSLIRVQVPNYQKPSKIVILHNYYPKPEYLIIGSFGPLGYLELEYADRSILYVYGP